MQISHETPTVVVVTDLHVRIVNLHPGRATRLLWLDHLRRAVYWAFGVLQRLEPPTATVQMLSVWGDAPIKSEWFRVTPGQEIKAPLKVSMGLPEEMALSRRVLSGMN